MADLTPEQAAILELLTRVQAMELTIAAQATAIRGLRLQLAAQAAEGREAGADGRTGKSSTGARSRPLASAESPAGTWTCEGS